MGKMYPGEHEENIVKLAGNRSHLPPAIQTVMGKFRYELVSSVMLKDFCN